MAWDGVVNGQKFNTDEWERWQQGECGTYAAGLKTLNPKLKVAAANFGEHFFAHDGKHAYDSAGKHPMPYRGVSGKEHWAVEKNVDLGDYGEGHGEAPKADIFMAMKHATRHNILGGQWPRKIG